MSRIVIYSCCQQDFLCLRCHIFSMNRYEYCWHLWDHLQDAVGFHPKLSSERGFWGVHALMSDDKLEFERSRNSLFYRDHSPCLIKLTGLGACCCRCCQQQAPNSHRNRTARNTPNHRQMFDAWVRSVWVAVWADTVQATTVNDAELNDGFPLRWNIT